jgi:hypothetical protein
MPQQEGQTNYKYEDYASEVTVNRLPPTAALVNRTMTIKLDSGTLFSLEFVDLNKVVWRSDGEGWTDWCEVIEVRSTPTLSTLLLPICLVSHKPSSLTCIHGKFSLYVQLCAKVM